MSANFPVHSSSGPSNSFRRVLVCCIVLSPWCDSLCRGKAVVSPLCFLSAETFFCFFVLCFQLLLFIRLKSAPPRVHEFSSTVSFKRCSSYWKHLYCAHRKQTHFSKKKHHSVQSLTSERCLEVGIVRLLCDVKMDNSQLSAKTFSILVKKLEKE